MKTFAIAKKRSSSSMMLQRVAIPSPVDSNRHIQSASVREILRNPHLQAKLTVGAPDDVYEREADRVADEVMRMPKPRHQAADGSWAVQSQTFEMGNDIVLGRDRNTRRTDETENGETAVSRTSGDKTLVNGFPIDNRYYSRVSR